MLVLLHVNGNYRFISTSKANCVYWFLQWRRECLSGIDLLSNLQLQVSSRKWFCAIGVLATLELFKCVQPWALLLKRFQSSPALELVCLCDFFSAVCTWHNMWLLPFLLLVELSSSLSWPPCSEQVLVTLVSSQEHHLRKLQIWKSRWVSTYCFYTCIISTRLRLSKFYTWYAAWLL